jgi:hypothetical protein
MRLVGLRYVDDDHLLLDFEVDDGTHRSAEAVFARAGSTGIEVFNFDADFTRDYLTIPVSGWPDDLDFRDVRDLMTRFRTSARVDWAIDDALRRLREERAAQIHSR